MLSGWMMARTARLRQEAGLAEGIGVLLAIASSCLGGTAAAVTRYLVGNADPLTLAILRWGIGFSVVLPVAILLRARWPQRSDWLGVAVLDAKGAVKQQGKTGPDGIYLTDKLEKGEYRVYSFKQATPSEGQSTVSVEPGGTKSVTLDLFYRIRQ